MKAYSSTPQNQNQGFVKRSSQ